MQNRDAMNKHIYGCTFVQSIKACLSGADPEIFQGGGVEEENDC